MHSRHSGSQLSHKSAKVMIPQHQGIKNHLPLKYIDDFDSDEEDSDGESHVIAQVSHIETEEVVDKQKDVKPVTRIDLDAFTAQADF